MDASRLLMLSIAVYGGGALVSLLLYKHPVAARIAAGLSGLAGSLLGGGAAGAAVWGAAGRVSLPALLPFGRFAFEMDGLSTLMVAMICAVGFAVSLYSLSYRLDGQDQRCGLLGFLMNLLPACMLLVVTTTNSFYFLLFWEMMSLVSYFLVTFENRRETAVRAGYLYMLIAQSGGALIMLAILLFFINTGSFDFEALRLARLEAPWRSLIFLLAFVGFGAKAGMVPLHVWMPPAYEAAPAPASALLSTVMKKTAIYGILRFCVDLLGSSLLWWGLLVLLLGAVSAGLGALFALSERRLKRMLAYSSVENAGIILVGIGVGMSGLAAGSGPVALLGFLAALYHSLNHSFFKGLLFLSAGAVGSQVQTENLNEMGGLAKRMPWTGLAFLTGAMAVSAIPPLNGFVSEWFTYQALFTGSLEWDFSMRALLPLSAGLLALAGTLAAMAAIKAYASAFSGPARTPRAAQAGESPGSMLGGMSILGIGCALLGLGAPWITPWLAQITAAAFRLEGAGMAGGVWVYPLNPGQALLSPPLIALLLLGFLAVPWIIAALYGGQKAGVRRVKEPWNCGYAYSPGMAVSASSFDQTAGATFRSIHRFRAAALKPLQALAARSAAWPKAIARAEPVLEKYMREPTTRLLDVLGRSIQALQMGDVRMYCLYIIVTLAVLLIVIFR